MSTRSVKGRDLSKFDPKPDFSQFNRNSKVTRVATYDRMEVQVVDRHRIAVSGSARVLDRQQGNWYIWLLRIYSYGKNSKLLKEHHYRDTTLQLPPGNTVTTLTFMDVFDLNPGTYKVELTLYSVPPSFDTLKWKFGEDVKPKSGMALKRPQKVVIAP